MQTEPITIPTRGWWNMNIQEILSGVEVVGERLEIAEQLLVEVIRFGHVINTYGDELKEVLQKVRSLSQPIPGPEPQGASNPTS
jgi:hypothetical protein